MNLKSLKKSYNNISYDRALEKATRYCAYQERCLIEVEERLKVWGVTIEGSNKIIDELIELDFLNEDRFTESFVRGKYIIKKWGKHKIRTELFKRKIDSQKITKAIKQEIEEEEYLNTIKALIKKKAQLIIEKDSTKKRDKLYRFMLNKGYESELIAKELKINDGLF